MTETTDVFKNLVDIVAKLRAPEGCPWDRKQTHQSLRATFLQECYEVLTALDSGDSVELCEELGDLMLHVVLQAQIAAEAGEFELADSLRSINEKIVSRHPHVFGDTEVKNAVEASHNWARLKQVEKGTNDSMLAGVPREMPALGYSQEIQNRVAQVGFDWDEDEGVIDKLAEEISEFRKTENAERRTEEFGDMLFTLANIARRLGVDLEAALREANQRFYQRFAYMEEVCRQRGMNIGDLSFDEQNVLWEEAKQEECE